MKRLAVLILGCAVQGALPAAADRFKVFQAEPLCAEGERLPQDHQFQLGFVDDTYIAHYRLDGVVKELRFTVNTPGAFQGDGFPPEICGATVVLSLEGEPDIRGVLEYVPPVPGAEYRPWPYNVKLEGEPLRVLWFSGRYNTAVYGRVDLRDGDGGYKNVFFTGASAHRWE